MKTWMALVAWILTCCVAARAEEKKQSERPPDGIHWITPLNSEIPAMAFGIGPVPTKTPQDAANWTKIAKKSMFDNNKTLKSKWKELQFFVFPRPAEAKTFYDYQVPRMSRPLQQADFQKLTSLWKGTSVCVIFDEVKHTQRIYYPQRDPANWWKPLFAPPKKMAR